MALWTQADIDTLKVAVASGVLVVRYDGPPARMVTYHNLAEMRSLLAEMVREVATAAGTANPYRLAATRKGV
jgi:hypothetical protein